MHTNVVHIAPDQEASIAVEVIKHVKEEVGVELDAPTLPIEKLEREQEVDVAVTPLPIERVEENREVAVEIVVIVVIILPTEKLEKIRNIAASIGAIEKIKESQEVGAEIVVVTLPIKKTEGSRGVGAEIVEIIPIQKMKNHPKVAIDAAALHRIDAQRTQLQVEDQEAKVNRDRIPQACLVGVTQTKETLTPEKMIEITEKSNWTDIAVILMNL